MDKDSQDKSDLELLRTDYTGVLREACTTFVASADRAACALTAGVHRQENQAMLDRALVRMALAVHQATRLVIPSPDAMEYFGLPRSITASGFLPEPTIRVQDPGRETWDFRPWLSEKLSHLRENLYAMMDTVETLLQDHQEDSEESLSCADSASANSSSRPVVSAIQKGETGCSTAGGETLRQRLVDRSGYELRAARGYARDILNAIDSMGLTVIDWRIAG